MKEDSYNWVAINHTGMQICEVAGSSYHDLDRTKLKEFWLVDKHGRAIIKIDLKNGRQLIFRRRRTQDISGEILSTIHIVGYLEDGKFNLRYLHPNGVIELSDKDDLQLFDCEK